MRKRLKGPRWIPFLSSASELPAGFEWLLPALFQKFLSHITVFQEASNKALRNVFHQHPHHKLSPILSAMTDASYALSDYVQSIHPSFHNRILTCLLALDNLPSELQHIYEELGAKERLFLKFKREKDARETQIFRHIRQQGGHTANPFEEKYNKQIEEIFGKMEHVQEEKCILADKAKELVSPARALSPFRCPFIWFYISPFFCFIFFWGILLLMQMDRHMNRLNLEIKRLEEDGQIVPLVPLNPPAETNGTATPNGTPSAVTVAPGINGPSSVVTVNPPAARAPLPQRTASINSISLPAASVSHLSTPTPSGTARTSQKRKAATAFRRDSSVDEIAADEDSQVYCFCQQVSFGEMVACDNESCEKEWFHLPCVGLTSPPPPTGKWYCSECITKMAAQKQRQSEKKKVTK